MAQIAITSLSLPNLSQVHWVARALLLFSLVSGCLSVYYACEVRKIIGKFHQSGQVREWLVVDPTQKEWQGKDPKISYAALSIVSAPFKMVKFSIVTLLIGLAVYQGFIWTKSLDTVARDGDSRKVFIVYLVGAGLCMGIFGGTIVRKTFEKYLFRLRRTKLHHLSHGGDPNVVQSAVETGSIPQNNLPSLNQQNVANHNLGRCTDESQAAGMKEALQAAAHAHEQCAKANLQVALEYAKASASMHQRQV